MHQVGNQQAKQLAKGLICLQELLVLCLRYKYIRDQGATPVVVQCVRLPSLERVDLSDNMRGRLECTVCGAHCLLQCAICKAS